MLLSYVALEVVVVSEGFVAFRAFVGSKALMSGLDVSGIKKNILSVLMFFRKNFCKS